MSRIINFRVAQAEDVDAISALTARSIRALHTGSYADNVIDEAVRHAYGVDWQLIRDGTYFAAECGGKVVGAGGWSFRRTIAGAHGPDEPPAPRLDPDVDAARIRAFYIDPDCARRGIGASMLKESKDAARVAGFITAQLTSTLPAVAFYVAAGYRETGDFDLALPSGSLLKLRLMEKEL